MNKPSAAYATALEASKEIHKGKSFTGKFLRPHAIYIKSIIDRLGCKSILDYGCGKGLQYEWVIPSTGQTIEQFWGVSVTKYDPAYPPFAGEPNGRFDLVICTNVLGAIPVADLSWVIDRLYVLAGKALYVSERLGEARKQLGDNALRPSDWTDDDWKDALTRRAEVETTLATRRIEPGGAKTTRHFNTFGAGVWFPVAWPDGVRAMNHKWVP